MRLIYFLIVSILFRFSFKSPSRVSIGLETALFTAKSESYGYLTGTRVHYYWTLMMSNIREINVLASYSSG